jgi:beta-lactamase regulating signal transducer with metallopeptidase domain
MTHPLEAVAWTLIHFCWQAAAVAALYRVISIAIVRRSSQTRYIAALSSLLLMLALSSATFAWEIYSTPSPVTFNSVASNIAAPLPGDFPRTTAPGIIAAAQQPARFTLSELLPFIDAIWLLGVLALSIRSFGGWLYLRRLRLASITAAPQPVWAAFQRISTSLGITRSIAFRLSHAIASPMTIGTLRAVVLLPLSAISSLGPEELEVVLAHELAHVRRADFFWNILQTIAETLFFFHPAVWWINSRIRHERELCCDDLALTVCPNPVAYAHALYRLEEQRSRHLHLAMALDGHASRQTLFMRIARILGEPMTRIPNSPFRPFSLAAACAGLLVLLVPVPHLLASLNPNPQPAPKPTVVEASAPEVHVSPSPQVVVHIAKPSPYPAERASIAPEPAPIFQVASQSEDKPSPEAAPQSEDKAAPSPRPHSDYIDEMKAAGYDVDLDKLIAMKIQNITPMMARAMAQAGLGKPSADDLIACKIQGVTPEYIAELKKQGIEVKSFQDAIPYKLFGVTPEFAAGLKSAGFGDVTPKQLLSLRVQGVTPEYAQKIKKAFPNATVENLLQARIFRIDDEFIAQAEKHGFKNLDFDKLVKLRISGIFDDESVKP